MGEMCIVYILIFTVIAVSIIISVIKRLAKPRCFECDSDNIHYFNMKGGKPGKVTCSNCRTIYTAVLLPAIVREK